MSLLSVTTHAGEMREAGSDTSYRLISTFAADHLVRTSGRQR